MIGSAHMYKIYSDRDGLLINFCISSWILHPSRSSCVSISWDQYLGSQIPTFGVELRTRFKSVTKSEVGGKACFNIRNCQCQKRRPDEGPVAHWPDCWWWSLFFEGTKVYCCDAETRNSGGGRRDSGGETKTRRVGRGMFWERKESARGSAGLNDSSQTLIMPPPKKSARGGAIRRNRNRESE